MLETGFILRAIVGMTVVTLLLRAAPFIAGRWLRKLPLLVPLSQFLPPAIMTLLLLHTLQASMADNPGEAWQELAAAAVAILLQWRTRRTLLSIFGATLLYVLFRNTPFVA